MVTLSADSAVSSAAHISIALVKTTSLPSLRGLNIFKQFLGTVLHKAAIAQSRLQVGVAQERSDVRKVAALFGGDSGEDVAQVMHSDLGQPQCAARLLYGDA